MLATFRFLRQFLRPRPDGVVREESRYRRGEETLPATLYRPGGDSGRTGGLPGWMVLHGLTSRGREHPSLDRFARALAASGAVVLVPDFPEWRALEVAPERTAATIESAVLELDRSGLAEAGRVGAIGFSFGAAQALIAATDPALEGHLAGVVAWGGYLDIHRAVRYGFTGDHELDGKHYRGEPDPYGRWILAGNYLTLLPEHERDDDLADALLSLALEAGRQGIMSWAPATDPMKARLRPRLDPRQREVFDLLAPPSGAVWSPAERKRVENLSARLSAAAVEREPLLDPRPYTGRVPVPVLLAHGRKDRLIPWTELVRLERALPPDRVDHAAITSLFAHSFGQRRIPSPTVALEAVRFVRLITRVLRLF
jgi:dienelactone hydrolase